MDSFNIEIQERNLANLIKLGGLRTTDTFFPYTSGQIGGYFIQSIDICKDGKAYRQAIEDMTELAKRDIGLESFDLISGGDSRDWDFSNPMAFNLSLPHTKMYKNKASIGAVMKNQKVLHVADLNNEGSSARDSWVPQIKKSGGSIDDILFYVDRLEDGVEEVAKLGINRHVVVPLDSNAWQYLLKTGNIDSTTYNSMNERLEDKQTWAHNMLREHTSRLKEILEDPVSNGKGIKILNVGYSEIKDELVDRLKQLGYNGRFE